MNLYSSVAVRFLALCKTCGNENCFQDVPVVKGSSFVTSVLLIRSASLIQRRGRWLSAVVQAL